MAAYRMMACRMQVSPLPAGVEWNLDTCSNVLEYCMTGAAPDSAGTRPLALVLVHTSTAEDRTSLY